MYAKCGILMMDETEHEKPLFWIGRSYGDLLACPPEVRRTFGFALGLAQHGGKFVNAKPLKGFGGAGVVEVVEDWHSATFRCVYCVKFAERCMCCTLSRRSLRPAERRPSRRSIS